MYYLLRENFLTILFQVGPFLLTGSIPTSYILLVAISHLSGGVIIVVPPPAKMKFCEYKNYISLGQ